MIPSSDRERLCFTMNVVNEYALAGACIQRLLAAYDDAEVVVLVERESVPQATGWLATTDAPAHVCIVPTDADLYDVASGGAIVLAHLDAFLATDAAWWCKIDPDTWVRRRLAAWPARHGFAGTLQGGGTRAALQGGCILGHRSSVERLHASGALRSTALVDFASTWAAGSSHLLHRAREQRLVSFDFVHAWACEHAGLPLMPHPDIRSYWRKPPVAGERFAITHPHKDLFAAVPAEPSADEVRAIHDATTLMRASTPASATLAVISRGEDDLVDLADRVVWHFPRDAAGRYSGSHPATSADAIEHLEALRAAGLAYLVVPESSRWWLTHYDAFARHLAANYRVVADRPGVGSVWALTP